MATILKGTKICANISSLNHMTRPNFTLCLFKIFRKLLLVGYKTRTSTVPGEELLVFIEPDPSMIVDPAGTPAAVFPSDDQNDGYIGDRKESVKSNDINKNVSIKSDTTVPLKMSGPKSLVISFNTPADAIHFNDILQDHIDFVNPTSGSTTQVATYKMYVESGNEGSTETKKVSVAMIGVEPRRDFDQETQAESFMPSLASGASKFSGASSVSVLPPIPASVPRVAPTHAPELHKVWAQKRGGGLSKRSLYTRYFVIDKGTLYYYLEPSNEPPFGKTLRSTFFLSSYTVRLSADRKEQELVFIEFNVSDDLCKQPHNCKVE